jgi:hypothetical protein
MYENGPTQTSPASSAPFSMIAKGDTFGWVFCVAMAGGSYRD